MKISVSFCLPLICFLQTVQLSQGAQFFLNEDGSDSAMGVIVCSLIPCVDPSLGARNFFAPVATGPNRPGETAGTEEATVEGTGAENTILQELIRVTSQIVSAVLEEQRGDDAGGDGTPTTFDDEATAREKLRDVAIGIVNAFLERDDGTDETTANTTTTATQPTGGDVDDETTARERLRTVALGIIDAFFDGDDETEETRTFIAGAPDTSSVREIIRTQVIDIAIDALGSLVDRTQEDGGNRRRLGATLSKKEMYIQEYRAVMKKALLYMEGGEV